MDEIKRKKLKGNHFWYNYNGEYYKMSELVKISKTKFNKQTISMRMSNHFRKIKVYDSIDDLLTNDSKTKRTGTKNELKVDIEAVNFNEVMKMF